ncbi:PadR family transcriptional regulator [Tetragenococcus koreensis]|uniref:PadR family transcriptional regulator n=1 Tax=Tetragenococcus koreensis TaxID=290335 RepID=UPI001F3F02A2|nr:PadR family transcriptional regulator [Tetragenococcus koreensis]MDN6640504.1 PadR family transcriptional regulator [Tetragenococcus sp.]MDN6839634.1 PadR family transcriptional regulator [Tetragenococcus halophilus]MCF1584389.1 PadR family transcriptional regulator [Tetragenococcus koreensis]MCF1613938.1 PadR family transcriptional regulator [Tetragenococcus koreensis]MCF1620350.1 PadR family transcriptional regulator [Tetragenococcus koreensis]
MDEKIKRIYVPMTETAFYILLSLKTPRYGYLIMQHIEELTNGRIKMGAGTLYGGLSKMQKDGLIEIVKVENKRKIYQITALGNHLLNIEKERIKELYKNAEGIEN